MTDETPAKETPAPQTEDGPTIPTPVYIPVIEREEKAPEPFIKTLPGLLAGVAAVITAIVGLLSFANSQGWFPLRDRGVDVVSELRVVATSPEHEEQNVDPDLVEITIVFNQAVNQEQWSFAAVDEGVSPEILGDPTFTDAKTCVLPVRLAPDTTYGLSVNSEAHQNFIAAADPDLAAEPYVFTFTTGP